MSFNLIGYIVFAFAASITPGPNNLMLFAFGRTNNIKDAITLMSGIVSGFFILLYLSGYGIAQIITASPVVEIILKVICSAWLIYLGFILSKINPSMGNDINKKLGFREAFLMQFINPKAWFMAIAGAAAFMPELGNFHLNVFVFAAIFCLIGFPCMLVWLKMSGLISKVLKSEKSNKILGYTIFGLMVFSAISIWYK